jgi:hypothetical protein
MRRLVRGLVIALLFAAVGRVAVAQRATISGVVLEELTRLPVGDATVLLLGDSGRVVATTTADVIGRFRLDAATPGIYRIVAMRVGYIPKETLTLNIESGARAGIELELTRRPFLLDSVFIRDAADPAPIGPRQQLIHGRLLDDDTAEPIPGGTLELRDARKKRAGSAVTDSAGTFRIVTPAPGTYSLYGERPGYRPSEQSDVRLELGDTVVVEFRLSRRAALLAPILVTASAKPWTDRDRRYWLEELYDRMRRFGNQRYAQFILRDTIDAYDQRSFSIGEMLDRVIKVPVTRGPGCAGGKTYVERFQFDDGAAFYPLHLIDLIEVYTHPAIPAEFGSPVFTPGQRSAAVRPCRVVVLWPKARAKAR